MVLIGFSDTLSLAQLPVATKLVFIIMGVELSMNRLFG